jgi:hypothetical protein
MNLPIGVRAPESIIASLGFLPLFTIVPRPVTAIAYAA